MLLALISPPGLVSMIWIDPSCDDGDQAILISPRVGRGNLMFYKCTILWMVSIVVTMGAWEHDVCALLKILPKHLLHRGF